MYGGVGGVGGAGGASGSAEGAVDIAASDVAVTAVQNADGTWSVNVKLDAEECCGAPERDAAAAQSVADTLKALAPAELATILGLSGIGAGDVTVTAVQLLTGGTWSVSVDLDSAGCCGAPASDAAAAQSAADRLTAMTPAELATILDMSSSTVSSVISTTPATVATSGTAVVVAFAFVVDAGSYEPATSPASYAADLAGAIGAVISVTPASAAPGAVVVSFSFHIDADAYDPDTSPASYAAALAEELSSDGVGQGGIEVGTGGVVGGTGVPGAAGYSAPNGAVDNGRIGSLAKINMAFGSRTRLRFTFIYSDSKTEKVVLQLMNWNLFDLGVDGIGGTDEAHPGCNGMVMMEASSGFNYKFPSESTRILVHKNGTQTWFMSQANGPTPTDAASPAQAKQQNANEVTP